MPVSVTGFLSGPIHQHFQKRAQQRFDGEMDASGTRWAGLSDATKSWRESQGYAPEHPINKRTGDLEANMTQSVADIIPANGSPMLLWPGRSVQRGRDGTKVLQAQGKLRQKNGEMSTPRPVIDFDESDLASLLIMAQKFFIGGGIR